MTAEKPWQVPNHQTVEFEEKRNPFCICVFVINEGEKLLRQLEKMQPICRDLADIAVADGGSTDGSTDHEKLKSLGVNTLLVKQDSGKLGSQMRMAFAWALRRGYEGVIVVDGNGKDGMEAIPRFVEELKKGVDHVQGSRFIPGGYHENTPKSRLLGLKLLHAPLMRLASGFHYTDTTNGFRAYSAKLLSDDKIRIFRDCFTGYELHYYLALRAAQLGFECSEIPVSRVYPATGKVPTKISGLKGNFDVIRKLFLACIGHYDPASFAKFRKQIELVLVPVLCIIGAYFMYQNYYHNSLKIHSDQYFHNAENFSESLIIPSRVRDYVKGSTPWWYFPYHDTGFSKDVPYSRSIGLQGILSGVFCKYFTSPKSPVEKRIEKVRRMWVCFSIAVYLLLLLWAYHEFGLATAVFGYFAFLFSPWLVAFSRNFYWLPGTFLLPFCAVVLCYWNRERLSRKFTVFASLLLFAAFLLRFACGYEFMTCVFFAAFIPLTYYGVKYRWSWGRYLSNIMISFGIGISAFLTSFVFLFLQSKAIFHYSFSQAILALKNNVMYRTGTGTGILEGATLESFLAPLDKVFSTYFFRGTPVVFDWHYIFVSVLFAWAFISFFLFYFDHRGNLVDNRNRKAFALLTAGALSFLSPLSWLVLAKGHSCVHDFIVYFIFSLPAVPFMLMGVCYFWLSSFGAFFASLFGKEKIRALIFLLLLLSLPLLYCVWRYYDCSGYWIMKRVVTQQPNFRTKGLYFKLDKSKLWIVADKNADLKDTFFLHLITPGGRYDNADFRWSENEVSLPFFAPFRLVVREVSPFMYSKIEFGQYSLLPGNKIKILWSSAMPVEHIKEFPIYRITDSSWDNGVSRYAKVLLSTGYSLPELQRFVGTTATIAPGKKVTITALRQQGPFVWAFFD